MMHFTVIILLFSFPLYPSLLKKSETPKTAILTTLDGGRKKIPYSCFEEGKGLLDQLDELERMFNDAKIDETGNKVYELPEQICDKKTLHKLVKIGKYALFLRDHKMPVDHLISYIRAQTQREGKDDVQRQARILHASRFLGIDMISKPVVECLAQNLDSKEMREQCIKEGGYHIEVCAEVANAVAREMMNDRYRSRQVDVLLAEREERRLPQVLIKKSAELGIKEDHLWLSPYGQYVICQSKIGVHLFDLADPEKRSVALCEYDSVSNMQCGFSPNNFFAVVRFDTSDEQQVLLCAVLPLKCWIDEQFCMPHATIDEFPKVSSITASETYFAGASGKKLFSKGFGELSGHEAKVRAIGSSPDGRVLLSADKTVVISWNIAEKKPRMKWQHGLKKPFLSKVVVSDDGCYAALHGTEDDRYVIKLWEEKTGDCQQTIDLYCDLGEHKQSLLEDICFDKDGSLVCLYRQRHSRHSDDPHKTLFRFVKGPREWDRGRRLLESALAVAADGSALLRSEGDYGLVRRATQDHVFKDTLTALLIPEHIAVMAHCMDSFAAMKEVPDSMKHCVDASPEEIREILQFQK